MQTESIAQEAQRRGVSETTVKNLRRGMELRPERKQLTQADVDALPEGARVWVKWSGGNGPHLYTVSIRSSARWAKECDAPLNGVGAHPLTQAWLTDGTEQP